MEGKNNSYKKKTHTYIFKAIAATGSDSAHGSGQSQLQAF